MYCAKYKSEPCMMSPECYSVCEELDCWRGEENNPFFKLVVPSDTTAENGKNLCIFYNSIDQNQCKGCQIYIDLLKFESNKPILEPYHEFILSVILVFVVFIVIIIAYYNLALAIRGKPPFSVCRLCPQILFPRGVRGLGRHNVEEEDVQEPKITTSKNYKPLAGGNNQRKL